MGVAKKWGAGQGNALAETDSKFRALVDHSLTGILIISTRDIRFTNRTFEEITGYTREDLEAMSPWDMVHPEEREKIRRMTLARLKRKKVRDYYETRWVRKDGEEIWVEVRATVVEDCGEPLTLVNVVDITERRKAEEALQKREIELEIQSRKLEETNTALRVLLNQRKEDERKLQGTILFNLEKLVIPFVERLEDIPLEPKHRAYAKIIKSNLRDIVSPFLRDLGEGHATLSPRQVQIVALIKEGKTTKEIADILCVSKAAVDFHRDKIRKKLGLTHRKVNLRSYLSRMQERL